MSLLTEEQSALSLAQSKGEIESRKQWQIQHIPMPFCLNDTEQKSPAFGSSRKTTLI